MSVQILVPYRPDSGHRDRAWAWTQTWWQRHHPDWPIILGTAPDPFNRAPAICDAAERAHATIFVIADADIWCDGIAEAVEAVQHGAPWAVPHTLLNRLDETTTDRILNGGPLAPIGYDQKPYRGHLAGTLLVVSAETFAEAPPDRRFTGWGQEDDAWALALRTLVDEPWRGTADLWHLWHPHPQRISRARGNADGWTLWKRYRAAKDNPQAMRTLIEESRCPSATASPSRSSEPSPAATTSTATRPRRKTSPTSR